MKHRLALIPSLLVALTLFLAPVAAFASANSIVYTSVSCDVGSASVNVNGTLLEAHTGVTKVSVNGIYITSYHWSYNTGGLVTQTIALPGGTLHSGDVVTAVNGAGSSSVSTTCGTPPYLPLTFVLRIITCNTPLYTTAGGVALSTGEAFTTNQTWFVNPTPAKDAKGASWTEVFAGGYTDGFIPTSCVGVKPAGYMGN